MGNEKRADAAREGSREGRGWRGRGHEARVAAVPVVVAVMMGASEKGSGRVSTKRCRYGVVRRDKLWNFEIIKGKNVCCASLSKRRVQPGKWDVCTNCGSTVPRRPNFSVCQYY